LAGIAQSPTSFAVIGVTTAGRRTRGISARSRDAIGGWGFPRRCLSTVTIRGLLFAAPTEACSPAEGACSGRGRLAPTRSARATAPRRCRERAAIRVDDQMRDACFDASASKSWTSC